MPHSDDTWLDETNAKCAQAMVAWLKSTINISRAIKTMNAGEMQALAAVAWSVMIVEISRRASSQPQAALLSELYLG